MTDPAESNEKSANQPSPYAPPAILDENLAAVEGMLPERMPFAVSLVYAIVMAVVTGLLIGLMDSSVGGGSVTLLVFSSPLVAIAGFVWICFAYFAGKGGAAKSLLWKLFITIAVPFASMVLFVPTCIGAGIVMLPGMGSKLGGMTFIIPIFIAYWVTCFVIAIRMRSRLRRPSSELLPGPYISIETPPDTHSPQ